MKCHQCKKETPDIAKFCKFCGTPIEHNKGNLSNYKACENGHNYNINIGGCPFCPPEPSTVKTVMDIPSAAESDKTVLDGQTAVKMDNNFDRTVIDKSGPVLQAVNKPNFGAGVSNISDKTVVFSSDRTPSNPLMNQGQPQNQSNSLPIATRKLVGWLVTFDINPNGTDFRLYEGRTKIGKNMKSDIVLNRPGVSDDHALLLFRDGKYIIQDQLSTNGTFVNDENVEDKIYMSENDMIRIGSVNLKLKTI